MILDWMDYWLKWVYTHGRDTHYDSKCPVQQWPRQKFINGWFKLQCICKEGIVVSQFLLLKTGSWIMQFRSFHYLTIIVYEPRFITCTCHYMACNFFELF